MANQTLNRGVYDPEEENDPSYERPDLGPGHNTPAGKSYDPRGHDSAAGDPSDPRGDGESTPDKGSLQDAEKSGGLYNSRGDTQNGKGALGSSGLAAAESGTTSPGQQFGFNPTDALSGVGGLKVFLGRNRRKALIGGGAGAGIIGLIIGAFFILIPLKIEHIVSNLQNRFFATSKSAVSDETHIMFTNYIKSQLGPAMKIGCDKQGGLTISKNCNVNVTGNTSNPVINLYKTWSQAKLENKLADNYGIELQYNKAQRTYYLKAPGINGQAKVGTAATGIDNRFDQVDRGTVRQAFKNAETGMTSWDKVMFRYKVGRLLEEKYGIKRCIIFCGTRDTFADKVNGKKQAAQVFLVQRVITPRTETLGIVLQCLLDPTCTPEKTQPSTAVDGSTGELSGSPENPQVDSQIRTKLAALAGTYGIADAATVDKMLQDYKDISEKGYQQYVLKQALEKIGLSELSDKVADATPVIGWVNAASSLIADLNTLGPKVKKLSYITNAAAAVPLFMMYRSYADEVHTGHIDATELGSMTTALGPGTHGPASDPQIGGTATAESTPLYGNLIGGGGGTSTTASLINNVQPSTVYAGSTSTTSSNYRCSGNKQVSSGQLVCPEEVLGQGNSTLDSIHSVLNAPGISLITATASFIHSIASIISGFIGNLLSFIISNVPGLGSLANLVNNALAPFFKGLIGLIIPNPFGTNMSGGRTFDMMAAGADVSGNDYAHTGLGGKAISATASAQIASKQESEAQQQFSQQSFFARMFSTDSQYSLISKVAMTMPFSMQSSAETNFGSLISNPFGALTQGFSSLFSGKTNAATISGVVNGQDAFGVTQYQPQTETDPLKYWNDHCSDNASQAYQNDTDYKNSRGGQGWNGEAAANPDPNTGMPNNTTANPCLLIKATTGSAGGAYDSSLLTQDDLADVNGTSSGSSDTSSGTSLNIQGAQKAAQQASTGGVKVGFALYDSSGKKLGNFSETAQNPGASITKSMLLVAYLKQAGSGSLSSQAKSELTAMIENSDNGAANWVYSHLTNGAAAVKSVASAAGMSSFGFDTSDPEYVLGQSKITADDFAKFFSKIDTLMPSSQKDFGMNLLASLSSADQNGLLQAGLPGTVYSKEGWKPESSGLGAPYVVNQAAQFASGGTTYGVAVTVGGTSDQSSGEAIVKNVVSALIGSGGQ